MSTDRERPKLSFEVEKPDWSKLPRAPHCDPRILHHPTLDGCDFCAKATELQAERERLDISNSGHTNRKYPCPADQARGKAQYSTWPGNRAKTYEQLDEEAAAFAQQLRDLGLVVDK